MSQIIGELTRKGAVCEKCEKETFVTFRCEECHNGFCRDCIVTKDGRQLCLKCAGGDDRK